MQKYRGEAAFWGWGGFDEQHVLPYGTKEEIEAETKRMMNVMDKSGMYLDPGITYRRILSLRISLRCMKRRRFIDRFFMVRF